MTMVMGDLVEGPDPGPGARSLKTAATVLRALRLLGDHPEGLSSHDLSARLGKSPSTARYMINTLCAAGYAVRTAGGRCHIADAPPWGAWSLDDADAPAGGADDGAGAVPAPDDVLADAVTELYRRTRQRSYVVRRSTPVVATVTDVRGHQGLSRHPRLVGHVAPDHAHALALTRVLLAVSPAYLEAVVSEPLAALTDRTVTDPDRLGRLLDRVRREGHATEVGECAEGFATVAAPVACPAGTATVALGLSASTRRFDADAAALVDAVTTVAERTRRRWAAVAPPR